MPWVTNDDGSETDTGTGAVTEKPDYMSPADRATQPEPEDADDLTITSEPAPKRRRSSR